MELLAERGGEPHQLGPGARSGWQVLRGGETDEALASTDAAVIWSLGTLADRYPQLETLLASDPASGEWLPDHTGGI